MTWVVIFKARAKALDASYSETAKRMRAMALNEYGCLGFDSCTEGDQEIALSYWPDEDHIRRWKAAAEHLAAQTLGRQRWYADYSVEVAQVVRHYAHATGDATPP